MKASNLTIAVVCWSLPALSAQTPVTLELGKPVTAELAGGLTHVYTVTA